MRGITLNGRRAQPTPRAHAAAANALLHTLLAGKQLVRRVVAAMMAADCEEVVLEAEVSNAGALALYQALGFIRDKRLHKCVPGCRSCSVPVGRNPAERWSIARSAWSWR